MVKSSQYSQPLDQRQVEFESDFLVIQDLVKAYPKSRGEQTVVLDKPRLA
jgi:hypothetical protein